MYCSNCGKEISKEGKFCRHCGASTGNNIHKELSEKREETTAVVDNPGNADVEDNYKETSAKKFKGAIIATLALAGLAAAQILLSSYVGTELSQDEVVGGWIITGLIIGAALLLKPAPKIILPLVIIWGLLDSIIWFVNAVDTGYVESNFGFFIMWASIRLGIIGTLIDAAQWVFTKDKSKLI